MGQHGKHTRFKPNQTRVNCANPGSVVPTSSKWSSPGRHEYSNLSPTRFTPAGTALYSTSSVVPARESLARMPLQEPTVAAPPLAHNRPFSCIFEFRNLLIKCLFWIRSSGEIQQAISALQRPTTLRSDPPLPLNIDHRLVLAKITFANSDPPFTNHVAIRQYML